MTASRTIGLVLAASIPATAALAADLPSRKMEPAVQSQLPAVDGVNAKLEAFGGLSQRLSQDPMAPFFTRNQWRPAAGVLGSVTFPMGHSFGLQIDGMAATAGIGVALGFGSLPEHLVAMPFVGARRRRHGQ